MQDVRLEVLRKEILIQELRMEELRVEWAATVLTAPADGMITELRLGVGDAAMSGQAVLMLSEARADQVIAYLASGLEKDIALGSELRLATFSNPPRVVRARVSKLGTGIVEIPERLSPGTTRSWGRPFLVTVPEELKLMSGELVRIVDL